MTESNAAARRYAEVAGVEMEIVGDLAAWISEPTTKIVTVGDADELDRVRDDLAVRFGGRAFVAKSLPIFLEFAAPGISKGSGCAELASRLGFEREQAIAFGDAENDRELLAWAGLGVAMGDPNPTLDDVADWHVPPVEEDGVAQFLEALV